MATAVTLMPSSMVLFPGPFTFNWCMDQKPRQVKSDHSSLPQANNKFVVLHCTNAALDQLDLRRKHPDAGKQFTAHGKICRDYSNDLVLIQIELRVAVI